MPVYEYVCPTCKSSFEELRPMARASDPAHCPACATEGRKKISVFMIGRESWADLSPMMADGGGGGCACGGACSCGA